MIRSDAPFILFAVVDAMLTATPAPLVAIGTALVIRRGITTFLDSHESPAPR